MPILETGKKAHRTSDGMVAAAEKRAAKPGETKKADHTSI